MLHTGANTETIRISYDTTGGTHVVITDTYAGGAADPATSGAAVGTRLYSVYATVQYVTDDTVLTAYTDAEVEALIRADAVEISGGAYLLDAAETSSTDITEDVVAEVSEVELQWYATMPDSATLYLTRELDWDTDRIKPYVTLTANVGGITYTKSWNLGVFCPGQPETNFGETPRIYSVNCYSKLSILNRPVGDSYTVAASTDYLTAVQAVITASGMTGVSYSFDWSGTKNTTAALAWVLDSSETTYLKICNDLLAMAGYEPLWADSEGRFRSSPLTDYDTAPSVWTFDLTDEETTMVEEDRTQTEDEQDRTNYWIFVRNGVSALPSDGSGLHVIDNASGGTEYRRVVYLDADSQTELEARGEQIAAQAASRKKSIDFYTSPNPAMYGWGRFPVVTYTDTEAGGTLRAKVTGFRVSLEGMKSDVESEVID
jgi:hypothetical protein